MSGKKELSLYFHIPFCQKKCPYCHFYSDRYTPAKAIEFKKSLLQEIEQKRALFEKAKIISIYFGGGTPTLIGAKAIEEILEKISHAKDCEITIETNPEDISLNKLKEFRAIGINRLSIGVQSFHDPSLMVLKRRHDTAKAIQAIHDAKTAGFDNISIDLMYDLPHQTMDDWRYSLQKASTLPITHISLYNLTIEPNTYFDKIRNKLSPHLPKEKLSLAFLQEAIDVFEKSGFERYEISAFAKDKKISIHNVGYWTGRCFLGLGPSAFSYFEDKRFQNVSNLSVYEQMIKEEKAPIDFEETLSPIARVRELLAINLRMIEGINLTTFEKSHGKIDPEGEKVLEKLCAEGLLVNNDSQYRLTDKGLLFYDTVAEWIIA